MENFLIGTFRGIGEEKEARLEKNMISGDIIPIFLVNLIFRKVLFLQGMHQVSRGQHI